MHVEFSSLMHVHSCSEMTVLHQRPMTTYLWESILNLSVLSRYLYRVDNCVSSCEQPHLHVRIGPIALSTSSSLTAVQNAITTRGCKVSGLRYFISLQRLTLLIGNPHARTWAVTYKPGNIDNEITPILLSTWKLAQITFILKSNSKTH